MRNRNNIVPVIVHTYILRAIREKLCRSTIKGPEADGIWKILSVEGRNIVFENYSLFLRLSNFNVKNPRFIPLRNTIIIITSKSITNPRYESQRERGPRDSCLRFIV